MQQRSTEQRSAVDSRRRPTNGLTENDGHENDGPSKLQEIAGHEKDGPSSRA